MAEEKCEELTKEMLKLQPTQELTEEYKGSIDGEKVEEEDSKNYDAQHETDS